MGRRAVPVQAVSGPLARYAPGFASELTARGYSPWSVRRRLWLLDHLSRWLERERLQPGGLTLRRVEEFLRARRAAGYVTWVSPRSLVLPLDYLREIGVVPVVASTAPAGPLEELLRAYRRYLACERGLAESTMAAYEHGARLFLSARLGAGGSGLDRLTPADVTGFLAHACRERSVPSAKALVAGLPSLLRYLEVAGLTATPLAGVVPGVAGRRGGTPPRGLEPALVARLLASCDRRRTVGRRDYAILLLLVRLGLRAGEVAALRLEDVDWRRGEILIRGKGDRHERLPLPADVGEALACYLRRRRPGDGSRTLFVRVIAPRGALRATAVGAVVHDACVRAGSSRVGAHRLRHTAGTGMLRAGASLPEIAEVLRHRRLKTTAIYAKVDHAALRALAQRWPAGAA